MRDAGEIRGIRNFEPRGTLQVVDDMEVGKNMKDMDDSKGEELRFAQSIGNVEFEVLTTWPLLKGFSRVLSQSILGSLEFASLLKKTQNSILYGLWLATDFFYHDLVATTEVPDLPFAGGSHRPKT